MKEKLGTIFFAAVIAVIGYIMVSTAAKHTALDNAAMLQWRYESVVRP